MRQTTRLRIAGVVGTAAIWLTGCGDDAEQITKEDFVEQADALCQEAQDELEPAWEAMWAEVGDVDMDDPAGQVQVFAGMSGVVDLSAATWHDLADDIRDLGAPPGDEDLLAELLDDLDAAVDEFASMIHAAAGGDEEAMEYLDGDDDAIDLVNRRAHDYGLAVCGSGS